MNLTITQPVRSSTGALIPEGTKLSFDGKGIAKTKHGDVERAKLPMLFISGAKGPFLTARQARLLNDNHKFQESIKKQYPNWCHCILYGDLLYVFVWDSREIIDVLDLQKYAKPQPITRTLVNKTTGERKEQVVGQTKPWLDNLCKNNKKHKK
jgi:hypothetical protein